MYGKCECIANGFTFVPILHGSFFYICRVCGCVYLYVGGNQNIIAYFDTIIIYECTVHVDNDFIAYEYIFSVFAAKVDVYMDIFSQMPEHFP